MRHGLAPEVPLADDLHLGCGGVNLDRSDVHHAVEQAPGEVRLEFQQRFIDRRHCQFRILRQAPAIRGFYPDPDLRLLPRLIDGRRRLNVDIQSVRLPADLDFCIAQAIGRLAEIGQGAGRGRDFRLPWEMQFL